MDADDYASGLNRLEEEDDRRSTDGRRLRRWMRDNGVSTEEFAAMSAIDAGRVEEILAGRVSLNEEETVRLESVAGIPANQWVSID